MPLFRFFLAGLCLLTTFSPLFADTGSLINWTESDMPTALKLAEKQNKPLFVCWGGGLVSSLQCRKNDNLQRPGFHSRYTRLH